MLQGAIIDTMVQNRTLFIKDLAPIEFNNAQNVEVIGIDALPQQARELTDTDIITAPLFGTVDAFEIAAILQENQYQGTFLAISPTLPARDQIIREFKKHFPKVKFDIVEAEDL